MREILFRGKRCKDGEWVVGSYYKQMEFYGTPFESHVIITSTDDLEYDQALEFHCVQPETVGQFTGLTANGVKIFEGDIIRAKIEGGNHSGFTWPNMQVDFQQGSFCLNDRNGYVFCVLGAFAPSVTLEVIGNIHDNPELLEG